MPYDITTFSLPGGSRCIRIEGSGYISKEDADYLLTHTDPGRPLHGLPMLALTEKMEGMSPEARRAFTRSGPEKPRGWIAVVVTNPLMRVTTNFIVRIQRNRKVKMFATEAEAAQWLDERAREDASQAQVPAP